MSIFNKNSLNQQYKFLGETGDNAGGFEKIDGAEFVTGNKIPHVVSVYPYQASTKISESEDITVNLPAEQHYAENTFGLGANTMVSVSEDNFLQYKNVCGYLRISLYGEGVSVSSITLKGNNGEKLAGKASVTMPLDGTPTAVFANEATGEITLICDTPVALGVTAEESVDFWLVVPPVTFSEGFTVIVTQTTGGTFEKSTTKGITIERSNLSKMSPMEVQEVTPTRNIVFADEKLKAKLVAAFDTSGDGELSYEEASTVATLEGVFTDYDYYEYTHFDEFEYFTGVQRVENNLFKDWVSLESIVIPDNVKSIGYRAFDSCQKLSSIVVPNQVSTIYGYAFINCTGLVSVTLPKSLREIASNAFSNCPNLTTLYISDLVAWLNCSLANWSSNPLAGEEDWSSAMSDEKERHLILNGDEVVDVVIPQEVTAINAYSFTGCNNILSITVHEGITSIGVGAFGSCTRLSHIALPSALSIIEDATFFNCHGLKSISLPSGLRSIRAMAFDGCKGLLSIELPDNVTEIKKYAFHGCMSLEEVTLPRYVSSIEDATFYACTGLKRLVLPQYIKTIGYNAFSACIQLETVSIPSEIIQSINGRAFADDTSLKSITIHASTPPSLSYDSLENTNDQFIIYVPAESVELYKTKQYWKNYSSRIQALPGDNYTLYDVIGSYSVEASYNLNDQWNQITLTMVVEESDDSLMGDIMITSLCPEILKRYGDTETGALYASFNTATGEIIIPASQVIAHNEDADIDWTVADYPETQDLHLVLTEPGQILNEGNYCFYAGSYGLQCHTNAGIVFSRVSE